jgi:cbb3-type cytochrome oxidase subunit 1
MGLRFLKIAVVYLALGAVLGLWMGITAQFALAPVHAHLVLLGWASMALAGLIYHLYPDASRTRLAQIHFWLHNVGLPVFMVGLASLLTGHEGALPIVATGASIALLGLLLFTVNVLMHVKPAATQA